MMLNSTELLAGFGVQRSVLSPAPFPFRQQLCNPTVTRRCCVAPDPVTLHFALQLCPECSSLKAA